MTTLETFTPEHLRLWTRPSCYFGAQWPDFYAFLGQSRDSDALERSNFDSGLKAVRAVMSEDSIPPAETDSKSLFQEPTDTATVQVVRESHWAVGWVEWIAIHKSDAAALKRADEIKARLKDYPVVDEMLLSEYEDDEAQTVWRDCYRIKDRINYIREHRSQFEFHSLADMFGCVRGNYFGGYASELLN